MRIMIYRLFSFLAISSSLLMFESVLAEPVEGRDRVFLDVDKVLRQANELNANTMAPRAYNTAIKAYRSNETQFERKGDSPQLQTALQETQQLLQAAVVAANRTLAELEPAIKAQGLAQEANAETLTPKLWKEASNSLENAIAALERNRTAKAEDAAADAAKVFDQAELDAIKEQVLADARRQVTEAENEKVGKFAPLTLEQAKGLLEQAEAALNENRYDRERAVTLADRATYNVQRAFNLNRALKEVDDGDMTLEEYALKLEKPLEQAAQLMDGAGAAPRRLDQAGDAIAEYVMQLHQDSLGLSEANYELLALQNELEKLRKLQGIQEDQARRQAEARERINSIGKMFTPSEAEVFRQGDTVLIRLVGLNFESGKSLLQPSYFPLLKKVVAAARRFDDALVTVEGHTDSFGSDASNMALSQGRANSVLAFLRSSMTDRPADRLRAIGFGETRPVANNETEDGREKNRRIDLIIKPLN